MPTRSKRLRRSRKRRAIHPTRFLQLWAGGFPAADWNRDGVVNTFDVASFLSDWAVGCG